MSFGLYKGDSGDGRHRRTKERKKKEKEKEQAETDEAKRRERKTGRRMTLSEPERPQERKKRKKMGFPLIRRPSIYLRPPAIPCLLAQNPRHPHGAVGSSGPSKSGSLHKGG